MRSRSASGHNSFSDFDDFENDEKEAMTTTTLMLEGE